MGLENGAETCVRTPNVQQNISYPPSFAETMVIAYTILFGYRSISGALLCQFCWVFHYKSRVWDQTWLRRTTMTYTIYFVGALAFEETIVI